MSFTRLLLTCTAIFSLITITLATVGDSELDSRGFLNETSQFPFTSIGYFDNGCTGSFVGPCHVLTAGHCVLNPREFRFANGMEFHVGPQANGKFKFSFRHDEIKVTRRWQTLSDPTFDVALVRVFDPQKLIPNQLGFFQFGDSTRDELVNLNMAGYPSTNESTLLWYEVCEDVEFDYERRRFVNHDCFASEGSSGSPLWIYKREEGVREIRALHTSILQYNRNEIAPRPEALILSDNLLGEINHWIQELKC